MAVRNIRKAAKKANLTNTEGIARFLRACPVAATHISVGNAKIDNGHLVFKSEVKS